ncbi:MAG: oxidoreductase [Gemmatimonas sp.]|nr:oxidoreductase [Gemmatimonas sp.]
MVAAILLPMGAACVAILVRGYAARIALVTALLTAAVSVVTAIAVVRNGPLEYAMGGWRAPLGITLRVDGLSSLMLLLSASVAVPVFVYAAAHYARARSDERQGADFWPLALLLWGGLNGVFLSGDVFNQYVAVELTSLAAVALVTLGEGDAALSAALRYLLSTFAASMFYLLGVGHLYAVAGTLDIPSLAGTLEAEAASYSAAALITVALLFKSALFPLHFWLPRAHSAAPSQVSALLSSLVVTSAAYLFLRLWTTVFVSVAVPVVGQIIGGLGACAIVWGSLQALRQQRLKVMIAYSTVAQMGYLFLVVPLVTSALSTPGGGALWGETAWSGGVYHAIAHALAKAALFLSAGVIVGAIGTDKIVGISGIARQLPVATYAFGIASMSLIGLPPSGGFVAKWMLLTAAFKSGQWWWAIAIAAGGLLTAGYVFLVLGQGLSQASSDRDVELKSTSKAIEYSAFALAVAALALGVRVAEPLALLRVGLPIEMP